MAARFLTAVYFFLFIAGVAGGIWAKRGYGHPEYMMLFHLPAAIFLVLFLKRFLKKRSAVYKREIERVRERM